ncbi:MAG: hypothetical protein A2284_08985 [Deltaproteobacteria bacterium RIFOXYA12_FULL_61_11]|nr:MAG: hypothetical protein A2284_08985 [Deltaproteobacteria bacterium RIFOXYA12_FULL_61_11]
MDLLPRHISASISVIDGVDKGKNFPLRGIRTYFGRRDGDIMLNDSKISSRHFCIEYINGSFYLIDLGSTNGTFLNRCKVRESMLNNMDEIQIGFSTLVFQCGENHDMLRILDLGKTLSRPKERPVQPAEAVRNVPGETVRVNYPLPPPAAPSPRVFPEAQPQRDPRYPDQRQVDPRYQDPRPADPRFQEPRPAREQGEGQYPERQADPRFRDPGGARQRVFPDNDPAGPPTRRARMPLDQGSPVNEYPMQQRQPGPEQVASVRGQMMNQPLDRSLAIPKIRLFLEVTKGNDAGKRLKLEKGSVVIGRVNADVNLRDTDVSRRHALIEIFGRDQVVIRDLASTNGTFVNGRPVTSCKLNYLDEIRVGRTSLSLIIEEG